MPDYNQRRGQHQHQRRQEPQAWNSPFDKKWIKEGFKRDCIKYMEEFGQYLSEGRNALTTSQIRNFYGEVKRLEMKLSGSESEVWQSVMQDFLLLKPKLAYNAARAAKTTKNTKLIDFKKVIFEAHDSVDNKKEYLAFSQLIEGIIAFHKSFGGRD